MFFTPIYPHHAEPAITHNEFKLPREADVGPPAVRLGAIAAGGVPATDRRRADDRPPPDYSQYPVNKVDV